MRRSLLVLLWVLFPILHAGETRQFVVAFVQDSLHNPWRIAQVEEFKKALEPYPYITVKTTEGKGSAALQLARMEEMVAAGIDLLVTSPLDGEMMAPAIARIYQSGIPVVLLSRGVRGDAYTAYFHTDDREIGRKSARFIASGLKGSGRVLMLKGPPGATTTQQRTEGFLAEMERFPGIAVTERTAHYLTAEAIKQTENVLAEKIPFDAVYAQNDFMARGAVMALEAHGIDPKKLIITGVDYTRIGREMIRLGQMAASFPYPTMAAEGARAVRDILAGKSVPKESVIQAPMVTRENVERHTPIF